MQRTPPDLADCFSVQRSFAHAMLALRIATGPLWLGGLLSSISDGCGSVPTNIPRLPEHHDQGSILAMPVRLLQSGGELDFGLAQMLGLLLAAALIGLLLSAALFALNAWITTGFCRLNVAILEHGSDALGPLFSGRDRFFAMAGYKALAGLTISAALLVSVWPGALLAGYGYLVSSKTLMIAGAGLGLILGVPACVYVALGAYLGELSVALDDDSAAHALRRSWSLAARGRLPLFGFALVCLLVQFISVGGVLLCCVGVLATVPFARGLTGFAKTEGYLLLTRGFEPAAGYALWQRSAAEEHGGLAYPPPGPRGHARQGVPPAPYDQAPPGDRDGAGGDDGEGGAGEGGGGGTRS